jgi:hypothetical protein
MQYFRAVNKTKKEVVCPWCLGDEADAADWSPNTLGAILALQLEPCEAIGDDQEHGVMLKIDPSIGEQFARTMSKGVPKPQEPVERDLNSIIGRWAGDDVYLVGSPEREEYQESFGYKNISLELAVTWNRIIGDEDMQLKYRPDCECEPVATAKV